MNRIFSFLLARVSVIVTVLLFVSCSNNIQIVPKFLFKLPLGVLPGEFKHWNQSITTKLDNVITVHKNIFYIGNGSRILKMSSNGYLLDYIANDAYLVDQDQNFAVTTDNTLVESRYGSQIPFTGYPLYEVQDIAVDSRGRLIFTNAIFKPSEEVTHYKNNGDDEVYLLIYDEEKVLYNILRDGKHKYFGSTNGLYVKSNDDIVFISQENQSYVVFIMDNEGHTKEKLIFPLGEYPEYITNNTKTNSNEYQYFGIINSIVPSVKKNYIYVHFYYYKYIFDSYSDSILDLPLFASRIYVVNSRTGVYEDFIDVPFLQDQNLLLVSVLVDESLVLVNYTQEFSEYTLSNILSPQVLFLSSSGRTTKFNLEIPQIDFYDSEFTFDELGNIAAYFLLKDRIEVYRWRIRRNF